MTTIQKFEEISDITDEKIIVLVDEAHRSQYGIASGAMDKAIPNGIYFGFSGTPIDRNDKSTYRTFGDLIDQYGYEESKADGATLPIRHIGRLPQLFVEGEESIDVLFDRIIGAEPTMRSDLPDIITRIKSQGHKVSLISNGLKLGNENYVLRLKKAGLRHCYISMNGVDNDDWYEIIDELRCAQRKIQALRNITKHRFVTDLGCILVKGVNDFAPYNMMQLLHKENVKNCVVRFKTIGQIGRYMDQTNFTMEEMVNTIADQVGVSNDYILEWQKKWQYAQGHYEIDSFLFPLNPNARLVYRGGIWIKLVNWDITHSNREWPIPNSTRRGRITEDFKIAPFFEDIKLNEGNY